MSNERAIDPEFDAKVRAIVRNRQAEAFDNVDLDRLLRPEPLSHERVRWLAEQLMRASRSVDAYRDGQAILRQLNAA